MEQQHNSRLHKENPRNLTLKIKLEKYLRAVPEGLKKPHKEEIPKRDPNKRTETIPEEDIMILQILIEFIFPFRKRILNYAVLYGLFCEGF